MSNALKRYTTDGLPAVDTVAAWRNFLDQVYYGHNVRTFDEGAVFGSLEKRLFGHMGVSRHCATAHTISRTSELVKHDIAEQHVFVFPTNGVFSCRQRHREIDIKAGNLYVLNASEAFEVSTSNGASSIAVTIPSEIARYCIKNVDDKCCVGKAGEPAFAAALSVFFDSVMDNGSNADGLWLRDVCCGLLDDMLNPRLARTGQRWRTSTAARPLLLDAARREIRDRLHDKNFGVVEAAAACHVSLRHLQGAFQAVGSTFGRELLTARLERAAQLLRSTKRGTKQISQIADACGFSSPAHFSTRYRERYGISRRDEAPLDK